MTTTEHTSPVSIGEIVDGKYRVDRLVGAGGMGVVVAATHIQLEQVMALKLMHAEAARHGHLVQRFLREARAACRLKGEHVARVTDVGTLKGGIPFFVMEYLDGMDLGVMCKTKGPLPLLEAVTYILQACEAIAEAHSLGIVHRDIKPANLFVTRKPNGSPSVKVLDFGISKLDERSSPTADDMTSTGAILGSVHYMPPEQLRSARDADARSDVWALGAVLYRLLAGRPPFVADSVTEVGAMILRDTPTPLRILRADVPEVLDQAVLRCLAKEPDQRFQSVQQLGLGLASILSTIAPTTTGSYGGFVPEIFAAAIPQPPPSARATESQPGVTTPAEGLPAAGRLDTVDDSEVATVGIEAATSSLPDLPGSAATATFGTSAPTRPATTSSPNTASAQLALLAAAGEQSFGTGASWGMTQVGMHRRNRLVLTLAALSAGIVVSLLGALALVWGTSDPETEPAATAAEGTTTSTEPPASTSETLESTDDTEASSDASAEASSSEPAGPPDGGEGGADGASADASASASATAATRPPRHSGGGRPPKTKGPRDFGGRL